MTTTAVSLDQYALWACQEAASVLRDIIGNGPQVPAVVITKPYRAHESESTAEMVAFGSANERALEYARESIDYARKNRRLDYQLSGDLHFYGIILGVGHQPGERPREHHKPLVLNQMLQATIAAITTLVPADSLRICQQCNSFMVPDPTQSTCSGDPAHHHKFLG